MLGTAAPSWRSLLFCHGEVALLMFLGLVLVSGVPQLLETSSHFFCGTMSLVTHLLALLYFLFHATTIK